ncbi:MAG TPA: hypothetical protein VFJ24_01615 [Gaiellales bacterium]|nr:hypothetical protein [Gaiellales bacterium]
MADVKKVRVDTRITPAAQQDRWWEADDPGHAMASAAKRIYELQSFRYFQTAIHQRLYENQPTPRFGALSRPSPPPLTSSVFGNRVTLNVIKSCIDSVAAKIAKNKPRIEFVTSGGNWAQQERAKQLSKWVDGIFYETKFHRHAQRAFIDGAVEGTGAIKIWTEDNTIRCARVLPSELFVNEVEGIYGAPRSLYQRTFMSRTVLLRMFKNDAEAMRGIESAAAGQPGVPGNPLFMFAPLAQGDMLEVIEAWHLPSKPGAGDGRRLWTLGDGTLLVDDTWEKDYFPFAWFRWWDRLFGFWGRGLADELAGIQNEINQILRTIQRSQALMCVPRVFVEDGSQVVQDHITNEIGGIVRYRGNPPAFNTAPGASAELYQHLAMLYAKAFEIAGVSAMNATGTKPAGLNSGVSLREYNDIASERFVITGQRYEDLAMDAALIMIDYARDLYGGRTKRDVKVRAPDGKFVSEVPWSKVNLREDEYVMRPFPVSALPTHPAGRLEKVMELLQGGILDKQYALKLLDFPDLESVVSLETASVDAVNRQVTSALMDSEYIPPEPFQDLNLAKVIAQKSVIMAENDGYPESRLELLRRYIDDCDYLLKQAAPPPPPAAPPGAPAPGGPPPGAGAPPPGPLPTDVLAPGLNASAA